MTKKPTLLNGRVLQMEYFHEGEGVTMCQSVDADAFKEFLEAHTNEDVEVLFDDLGNGKEPFELKFKTVTIEENKEAEIQGLMWGDGITRKQAIKQIEKENNQ
jgi:hypothetical protein